MQWADALGIAVVLSTHRIGLTREFHRTLGIQESPGLILRFAFDDARSRFDVRFYLVAILFIIFDLEVAFLFPWAISLGSIGLFGFWSMVIFLGILTIGFIYEWRKGALEWE